MKEMGNKSFRISHNTQRIREFFNTDNSCECHGNYYLEQSGIVSVSEVPGKI